LQNDALELHACYTTADIDPCLREMITLMDPLQGSGGRSNLTAVKKKFSEQTFGRVALVDVPRL
jgi:hypothetical protein